MTKRLIAAALALALCAGLSACGPREAANTTEPSPATGSTEAPGPTEGAESAPVSLAPSVGPTENAAPTIEPTENVFEEAADLEFIFTSGFGAWGTELEFASDGSFTGAYHDSDMGDMGDEYPNGTVYVCSFDGSFSDVEQIDDFAYSMRLTALNADAEGAETIEDGIRYITASPYGLDGGTSFYLYRPGQPTDGLPEGLTEWLAASMAWSETPSSLPFWVLYNVDQGYAFYSTTDLY